MDKPWELSTEELTKRAISSLNKTNGITVPQTAKEQADEDAEDGYINDYDD